MNLVRCRLRPSASHPRRPASAVGCRLAAALALALALPACSGGVSLPGFGSSGSSSASSTPATDPNIFPKDYKAEVAGFMRLNLENPTKVKDAFIAVPVLKQVSGGSTHYVTCVRYNPRDGRQQYKGPQTSMALFFNGQLNQFLPEDTAVCAGMNYQRYPEIESMVP